MFLVFTLHAAFETPAIAGPAAPAAAAEWKHYGAPFQLASAVPASQVLANPGAFTANPVRVTGQLTEVCQAMGCWAVVRDDQGRTIRVTMKDHDFGIDKAGAGRACDVEGTLVKKAVDPKVVEHYASEGSKNAPEAGKTEVYELIASGVSVSRS